MGCAANGKSKALENKALLAETERTVADLRGAVDQSRLQTRRFQDEHDAALRERDEALSELQEFHSKLKLNGNVTDYSEVHELRGQLREAEANLGQECSRRCRIENRVTLLEDESRALRDELLAASASKAAERKASEKFRQDAGARDAVLTELRARASQLASEHEHMAAERDGLAAELEHLSRERDRAREELQEALRKAEASAATAAAAEAAAAEATAAVAAARSGTPSPGDSSKPMPLSSSSGRPRGDVATQQQAEGRPPRAPGSSGRRTVSPSPEPAAGTASAGLSGPPPVAERKRSSRKVTRASASSGVNAPRNTSDFIEHDGTASVQSDAGMAVKAKRRSKGKGKGDAKAETKATAPEDELAIETEVRPVQQNSSAPSGRRSRSGSMQRARATGSVSTVESHDGTSTTASTVRSSHAGAPRRADKTGTTERSRPVAPWDVDSSSAEDNAGSAGNAPAAGSAPSGGVQGHRRPSLPAAPGSTGPSPRQSLSAPWDEPDEDPQADSRSGSRLSSRRPSLTAPWDEPEEGSLAGRRRPSQTTAPGFRPGSRRPSAAALWDELDEGRQRQSQATPPGSRPGSRRPSTIAPWDEPDEGPATAATAPWDEPDGSASDSGTFQPAPRPKPKAGLAGTAPAPASAAAPASVPAAAQGVQLNGKAKSGAAKAPSTKSSPEKSPYVQAKPEPHENPSVQVFRFDFSVFDFLKHEALQSPREHVFTTEGRGSNAVGSPPVMLGAVPAAPLFSAGAAAAPAGSPAVTGGSKAAGNSKAVPKLNLNTGSEVWDPASAASMSEVRPLPRKEPTPPEIAGTPIMDDEQESLGDDDWPPQARRNSAARHA